MVWLWVDWPRDLYYSQIKFAALIRLPLHVEERVECGMYQDGQKAYSDRVPHGYQCGQAIKVAVLFCLITCNQTLLCTGAGAPGRAQKPMPAQSDRSNSICQSFWFITDQSLYWNCNSQVILRYCHTVTCKQSIVTCKQSIASKCLVHVKDALAVVLTPAMSSCTSAVQQFNPLSAL